MTFDLTAHMKAISRTVRNLERDGKPAKAVGLQPLLAERRLKVLAYRLIEYCFHAASRLRQRVRTDEV